MLTKKELEKINEYLNLLAVGLENNSLTVDEMHEVLDLSCRCFDEAENRS